MVVAFHDATLATRRALPLTWAGLSPAGSRQLPGALVPQFEIETAFGLARFVGTALLRRSLRRVHERNDVVHSP